MKRPSYGFQASIAIIAIAMYLFAVPYLIIQVVSYNSAKTTYNDRLLDYKETIEMGRSTWLRSDAVDLDIARENYKEARTVFHRSILVAGLSLCIGIVCTVVARRIQGPTTSSRGRYDSDEVAERANGVDNQ